MQSPFACEGAVFQAIEKELEKLKQVLNLRRSIEILCGGKKARGRKTKRGIRIVNIRVEVLNFYCSHSKLCNSKQAMVYDA